MQNSDPNIRLMLAFRSGDESALSDRYRRWAGPLLRYLERMVRERETAEELLQEAFIRVHGARERYSADARFSTWLFRIGRNLALNELDRAHRRMPHLSTDATDADGSAHCPARPLQSLVSREPSALTVLEARRASNRMISAGIDDELGPEDRERLDELLSGGDAHSARARTRSFRQVDEELRSMAAASIADEHLTTLLGTLQSRLEVDRSERTASWARERHSPVALGRNRRRWGLSSALAAAAVLVVYLVWPAKEPVGEAKVPLAGTVVALTDRTDAARALEEDLALALGTRDETSEPSAISNDDLDVIERLDLLDFLSTREMEEPG